MKIDGKCLCGAIQIEAEADPEKTVVCHCTDCQTGTASAFRVSIPVAGEDLKITGQPAVFVRTTAESGNPRAQGFCATCGTPLYATTPGEGVQKVYMLRVGIISGARHLADPLPDPPPIRSRIFPTSATKVLNSGRPEFRGREARGGTGALTPRRR